MDTLAIWHRIVAERNPQRLPEVIARECVFLSPIVHSPQRGQDLTILYLTGAMQVFNDSFRYVKEVVSGSHAVLEFECEVDGILINGVDIITFNAEGRISEFKVMVRPLKAVELIHQRMKTMLEQLAR